MLLLVLLVRFCNIGPLWPLRERLEGLPCGSRSAEGMVACSPNFGCALMLCFVAVIFTLSFVRAGENRDDVASSWCTDSS